MTGSLRTAKRERICAKGLSHINGEQINAYNHRLFFIFSVVVTSAILARLKQEK